MEIVELFPGCFVPFDLYCRVRALLVLWLACAALWLADRGLGSGHVDLLAELPAELTGAPPILLLRPAVETDASFQLTYLDRFFRGRTQAPDLLRYAITVSPPSVRLSRLSAIAADTITGSSRAGPALRVDGRAPDSDHLRTFVDSLRVMAPTASTEHSAQTGTGASDGFRIATEPEERRGGMAPE